MLTDRQFPSVFVLRRKRFTRRQRIDRHATTCPVTATAIFTIATREVSGIQEIEALDGCSQSTGQLPQPGNANGGREGYNASPRQWMLLVSHMLNDSRQ